MYISAVVPVFNEEENIEKLNSSLLKVLEEVNENYEIIYVNDGSTDGSKKILKKLAEKTKEIRVLDFRDNCGISAAMDAGFKKAEGELVVTLDSDLQNNPEDIPLLIEKIEKENYDAAVGWRYNRSDPLIKRISSRVANAVRNWLSNEDIKDTGCSLKVYRREALKRIKMFQGMHRFLPTLLKMEGCRVAEVKVSHFPRRHGESKFNIRNRIFRSFRDLLAVRWMKSRRLDYEIEDEY